MRHRKAGSIASAAVLGGLAVLSPAALARPIAKSVTATHVNCGSPRVHAGRVLHCGVSVTTVRGAATPPTGAVTVSTNVGANHGTLSLCTLVPANRRTSRCTFTYTPRQAQTAKIYANYGGDATHTASHASRTLIVIR